MSSSSGLAGLKCLQWTFRAIEFGCSVIVLGVYSYYIASMSGHNMSVPTDVKAVEGISAVGTIYTALGVLLVCCCAGHPAPSFVSLVLDIGLAGAFIYVAVANRAGASSCSSGTVNTVYGSGDAGATPGGSTDGVTGIPVVSGGGAGLPTFRLACQLETACLVVSCVAVLFFILSVPLEIHLNRTRYRASRPIRDADGEYISKSDHYGAPPQRRHGRRGLLGLGALGGAGAGAAYAHRGDPDVLPAHQQVSDMHTRQVALEPAWGEVSSLHDSDRLYFNDGESRDEHGPPVRMKSTTAPRAAADEYNEGDVGNREYSLYAEDENGNDHSEIGHTSKHRMSKEARLERFAG